jgi:hypothetical protein
MPDDTIIRGHVTLEWSDQVRFLVGPYAKALSKYTAIMLPVFGAVWASTLPDDVADNNGYGLKVFAFMRRTSVMP